MRSFSKIGTSTNICLTDCQGIAGEVVADTLVHTIIYELSELFLIFFNLSELFWTTFKHSQFFEEVVIGREGVNNLISLRCLMCP